MGSSCSCCCCCKREKSRAASLDEAERGTDNPSPPTPLEDLTTNKNLYITLYRYDATGPTQMSFESKEILELRDTSDSDWWHAKSLDGTRSGYVPRTYLTSPDSIEAQEWYGEDVDQGHSEALLQFLDTSIISAHGAFLVRPSGAQIGGLVLSVRADEKILHFRIQKSRDGKTFSIPALGNKPFPSIQALVQHHQQDADGLPVNLRRPIKRAELVPREFIESQAWEIKRETITKGERIGGGNFGDVFKGRWLGNTVVAIKQVKEGKTDPNFLSEAEKMKTFVHRNLICLYGVCTEAEPYWIITEFLDNGDLVHYLKKHKSSLPLNQLFNIGYQVASGMSYLEEKQCVHRDLAARNVLVGKNREVKVADFGLTAYLQEPVEGLTSVPTRWTAPEALGPKAAVWSTKSDVWSFGIVLWEIFSYGDIPYKDKSNSEVRSYVLSGKRLFCPGECLMLLHDLMMLCWNADPERRPTFESLKHTFYDFNDFVQGGGYVEPSTVLNSR